MTGGVPRWAVAFAILAGCGSSGAPHGAPAPTEGTPAAPSSSPAREGSGPAASGASGDPVPSGGLTAPVDLLRAVRADIAASSVYRDRESLVPLLVDGDPATAWNSRTDDLVGAFIDVRLPEDATVTSIEMTAGFTRVADSDLFTGNHRIARVRVLRNGEELVSHALDVESRDLQTIPVTGPGGVYRIEITEVVPGTRSDWREACISELRVMGRAPVVHEGRRFPRFAVGALPPPRGPAPPVDRAALARTLTTEVLGLAEAWADYERRGLQDDHESGEPGVARSDASRYDRERNRLLAQLVTWTEPVSEVDAEALRAAIARPVDFDRGWGVSRAPDLDDVDAALDALAAAVGSEAARCAVAHAQAHVRLSRIEFWIEKIQEWNEMSAYEYGVLEEDQGGPPAGMPNPADQPDYVDLAGDLETYRRQLLREPRRVVGPLLALAPADEDRVRADWQAMRAHLELARSACGWIN